ncbi:MATE family efflux transporter [Pectinatus sottacetonis]|uniref:MATE family efflux transporter n=1 Tax=Pectinatus sottacetonis TaxID=1002795 RepID=UPI0018C81C5C|nr:MATE family efflux transporter [Pectinatus sottacetonis]
MTKDLTTGGPAGLIFSFSVPLIIGNIFQQMYLLVDTLIVGRFLGVSALAAVGCSGCLMFLMIGFVLGFTNGVAIYTGQRFGAGDLAGVRKSTAACMLICVVMAVVLTVVGILLAKPMLIFMQTPAEVLPMAYAFISVIYGGITVTIMFNMLMNLIRALGDSRTPLYFLIFGSAANIGLEIIFIPVWGLGIVGAAAATVICQLISAVLCLLYIKKKMPVLHIKKSDCWPTAAFVWAHLRIGLPMGFQASIIALGAIILQVSLNNLGEFAVAGYAAAQKIDMIAVMPMMSFGMAMAAYTAQNYGARKIQRINQGVKKCILMSGIFSIFIGAFLIHFGPDMLRQFVGDGQPKVVEYGQLYLIIDGVSYIILSLLFIYRFTLQGLGQSIVPTIAGIMELVMRGVAAVFLVNIYGYIGACLANPLAWIGSCLPLAIMYYYTQRSLKSSY